MPKERTKKGEKGVLNPLKNRATTGKGGWKGDSQQFRSTASANLQLVGTKETNVGKGIGTRKGFRHAKRSA